MYSRGKLLENFISTYCAVLKHASSLERAFVHSSYVNENPGAGFVSNERLEFLGDAVLSFVISALLYERLPDVPEGELTKLRARIVNKKALSDAAVNAGIKELLLLGKGERKGGGADNPSILADAFEAVIGLLYTEAGADASREFIVKTLGESIDAALKAEASDFDWKGILQEASQRMFFVSPIYEVVREDGPSHKKVFTVGVSIKGEELGSGTGATKKEAEQAAAKAAFEKLKERGA
ncbi:MAG: ribonuclease III [Deltaproteobacteria bacterium]|nr:ribonuclease III [Deltaproteobacteria bacterium]